MMKVHSDWEVLNRGVNGERTDQILGRFERDVRGENPDIVVVLGGVNDVYQGLPEEFTKKNLSEIYGRSRDNGIALVTATILPYNTMTRRSAMVVKSLNTWVSSTSKELSVPFVDTNKVVADPKDRDRLAESPDGLHPGILGYRKMGEAISRIIERRLSG